MSTVRMHGKRRRVSVVVGPNARHTCTENLKAPVPISAGKGPPMKTSWFVGLLAAVGLVGIMGGRNYDRKARS